MKTKCFVFLECFAFQCISSSFSWDYFNLIYINACCKLLWENDRIGLHLSYIIEGPIKLKNDYAGP